MPKYAVFIVATASKFVGEFEADSEEEARDMAEENGEAYFSLCHQCASIDIGDIERMVVEEIKT